MARTRRAITTVTLVLGLASSGCAGWRTVQVSPRELLQVKGVPAVRVTRADKSKVEIYDPVLAGDSIIGHPSQTAIARLVMPLSQVESIATRQASISRTLLITLGVVGAVALYGLLQTLNQGY